MGYRLKNVKQKTIHLLEKQIENLWALGVERALT
jgi:hypothetical protein